MRNADKLCVGRPNVKNPPGTCKRRWEDNIKIDFKESEWKSVDWIHLARGRDRWP
jgi:hypothetical protein